MSFQFSFLCFSKSNSRNPGLKITKKRNLLHQAVWQKQILSRDQCAVSLHTYSFSDANSAFWVGGKGEAGLLGAEGQGPRSRAQAGLDELQAHALVGRQLLETAVKSGFPWSLSLLVPSPGSGRRSKQPWKTVSVSDPEFILLP